MIRVGTCLGLAGSVGEKQRCHHGFRDHDLDAEHSLLPRKTHKVWKASGKGLLGHQSERLDSQDESRAAAGSGRRGVLGAGPTGRGSVKTQHFLISACPCWWG